MDRLYLIDVTLVNSRGKQAKYTQLVYIIGAEKEDETEEVTEEVGEQDAIETKEIIEIF